MAMYHFLMGMEMGMASCDLFVRVMLVVRIAVLVWMNMSDRGVPMLVGMFLSGDQPDRRRHHDRSRKH